MMLRCINFECNDENVTVVNKKLEISNLIIIVYHSNAVKNNIGEHHTQTGNQQHQHKVANIIHKTAGEL